ncbi:hypothetical protein RintRC_5004 [Richelia intracellularis]|nr:hypothetical protein RintRC_5004 [Richelia intracellularis]
MFCACILFSGVAESGDELATPIFLENNVNKSTLILDKMDIEFAEKFF